MVVWPIRGEEGGGRAATKAAPEMNDGGDKGKRKSEKEGCARVFQLMRVVG